MQSAAKDEIIMVLACAFRTQAALIDRNEINSQARGSPKQTRDPN